MQMFSLPRKLIFIHSKVLLISPIGSYYFYSRTNVVLCSYMENLLFLCDTLVKSSHILFVLDYLLNSLFLSGNCVSGRAMVQAVIRRPLTAETRVRSRDDPSGRAV